MLVIQYDAQLCSQRLISNVDPLIINPPLQSVSNLAFCYQLSLSMIALLHKYMMAGCGRETRRNKDDSHSILECFFTVWGNALDTTSRVTPLLDAWGICYRQTQTKQKDRDEEGSNFADDGASSLVWVSDRTLIIPTPTSNHRAPMLFQCLQVITHLFRRAV